MDDATKTILKAILKGLEHHAFYVNGNGVKSPLLITDWYPKRVVSGVALGNVSGGAFVVDELPEGKQKHGTPYWLPIVDSQWLELLEEKPEAEEEPEAFGEVAPIGTPTPRVPVNSPQRETANTVK